MENKIKELLSCREKACINDPALTRAAVLIPLFKKNEEYYVLLTRRTHKVRHHKGQISFPGGRRDKGEDLLSTALREAKEEMGIEEKDVRILGELDDMCTVASDFCISPFVGMIPHPYPFKINHHEIQEIIEVPISAFLDENKFHKELRERNGEPLQVYFYQHEDHTIWGATARIMKQLLDLLPEEDKANLK
ncbi:MAG TPA: CoA pyrophosphatase [Thermodesulfobacteriota bacterium]|nr:CoA pyrophosphatase [Thermodesulfobacteriota bacterium]